MSRLGGGRQYQLLRVEQQERGGWDLYIPTSQNGNDPNATTKAAEVEDGEEFSVETCGKTEQGQMMDRRRRDVKDNEQCERGKDEEGSGVVEEEDNIVNVAAVFVIAGISYLSYRKLANF